MAFTLAPHVSTAATEHGLVLLDERAGRYWQLNETGALVLDHLLRGGTAGSAAAAVRERFTDTDAGVEAEVADLVEALRRAEVVTS